MPDETELDSPIYKFARDALNLSRKLGLPDDFLLKLIEEDDWSFCIKAHAVIETALREAIYKACFGHSARPPDTGKLHKFCTDLPLDGRTSKLSLSETFDLISPATVGHIRALSRLRNLFVHDVSRIGLSIRQAIVDTDNPGALLKAAVRAPLPPDPVTDGGVRYFMLVGLVFTLWEIDFRSQPPKTLIESLMEGPR